MNQEGQYLYAIVAANEERSFGPIGIGEQGNEVFTVCYQDIGAVISHHPSIKCAVNRANTVAHQKVMEEVMRHYPVLPVRFGTIGDEIGLIKERVLKGRYEELRGTLDYMKDKIELGLKALWADKETPFNQIVQENREIRLLRDRLISRKVRPQRDHIRLGEMVKKALDDKRQREEKEILDHFEGLWVEQKINRPFGDQMITNSAFLVTKEGEREFDERVEEVSQMYDGRIRFKYVGPVPPFNFVEITVKW
jgi:hypothetical protein